MRYKRWADAPKWWKVWYLLRHVYFDLIIENHQTILYLGIFGLAWHEGAFDSRVDSKIWGWSFYFWPTFSLKEGDYLFKYHFERIEHRKLPHVCLMGRERI